MIEKIYAKRSHYWDRVYFWKWHQQFKPELTRATMLVF